MKALIWFLLLLGALVGTGYFVDGDDLQSDIDDLPDVEPSAEQLFAGTQILSTN